MRKTAWKLVVTSVLSAAMGVFSIVDAQQPAADLILTNGKIITVDDTFSIAQAVAVRGDRIVAVGTNQEITRLAGPNARRIDLRGRAVVPGFIDNHGHFQEEGAFWTEELRLDGVESRKQALEMVRAKAQAKGPGQWVFTLGGFSPDQFVDDQKPFTRDEQDPFSPDNPVLLQFSRSETYLNSKAIEAIGLDTMNQPWIMRDPGGRPTGIIANAGEGAVRNAAGFLDAPNGQRSNRPVEVIEANSLAMLEDFSRVGVTGSGGACQYADLYRKLQREGKASVRWFCFRAPTRGLSVDQVIAEIPKLRYFDGDDWLDYVNWGERIRVPENEWGRVAREAAKAGIPIAIHSPDEGLIEEQLQQVEALNRDIPIRRLRWSFLHLEGINEDQIERMRKLNMFLAVQPRAVVMGQFFIREHGEDGYDMPPLKAIQDSGASWGFGSDSPEVNTYNPFNTLGFAVTGKMLGGAVVNKGTITREQALVAYTRSNAFFFFRENDLGSIQSGKLADLVVIDRDYLTVPADQIKAIQVVMTIVGGKVVYDAAAQTSER